MKSCVFFRWAGTRRSSGFRHLAKYLDREVAGVLVAARI
jgi:hypothetical protein